MRIHYNKAVASQIQIHGKAPLATVPTLLKRTRIGPDEPCMHGSSAGSATWRTADIRKNRTAPSPRLAVREAVVRTESH